MPPFSPCFQLTFDLYTFSLNREADSFSNAGTWILKEENTLLPALNTSSKTHKDDVLLSQYQQFFNSVLHGYQYAIL